jgi:hypothetical protein
MSSLHIWLTGIAVWFALPIAIGKALHKLNPTNDDDAHRRPAWDDVADLEAFLAQHPDNTGIRRATR